MPRILLLLVLVVIVASFPLISHWVSNNKDSSMDKNTFNIMIEEYINNNPDKILNSINKMRINNINNENKENIKNYKAQILSSNYPSAGNADSKITLVEFFDYSCSYCKMMSEDIRQLIAENKVNYIFRDLPILGEASEKFARSALAVHFINPAKYQDFFHAVLSRSEKVSDAMLSEIITSIGISEEDFQRSLTTNSNSIEKMLEDTKTLAQNLKITGTPAFVLGEDRLLIGAYDLPTLHSMINEIK